MHDENEGLEKLRRSIDRVALELPLTDPITSQKGLAGARLNRRALIAAAIVFLILAYPSYLGLFELPRLETEKERSPRSPVSIGLGERAVDGPVDLRVLSLPPGAGQLRATEDPDAVEQIRIGEDGRLALIVEPDPDWIQESGVYRLGIIDGEERTAGEWTLEGPQVARWMTAIDGICVVLPKHDFPPGRYRLRFSRRAGAGFEPLSSVSFAIIRDAGE